MADKTVYAAANFAALKKGDAVAVTRKNQKWVSAMLERGKLSAKVVKAEAFASPVRRRTARKHAAKNRPLRDG